MHYVITVHQRYRQTDVMLVIAIIGKAEDGMMVEKPVVSPLFIACRGWYSDL